MPDRNELTAVLGSALSTVAAGVAWISGLEFLTAILAAIAGALLTFYLAVLQQNRVWEREIQMKWTEEIYGPLYVDMWKVLQFFSNDQRRNSVVNDGLSSEVWPGIRSDYRYRIIRENLRAQLDAFYQMVSQTSAELGEMKGLASRIVLEQTIQSTGLNISVLDWVVRWRFVGQGPQDSAFHPAEALVFGESIMPYVKRLHPGAESYFFYLQAEYTGGPGRQNVPIDQARVELIFINMEKAFNANEKAKEYADDVKKIRSEGESLRNELGVIVEKPWKH